MQRCPHCKVTIAGHKTCCPLCGGTLIGTPEPDTEVFPVLEKPPVSGGFVLRILALLAIVVSATCLLINFELYPEVWWSFFMINFSRKEIIFYATVHYGVGSRHYTGRPSEPP